MCVSTGSVEKVSDTSIFARAVGERQIVVYGMMLDLAHPVWRVLVEGRRQNRDTWLGKGETIPALAA